MMLQTAQAPRPKFSGRLPVRTGLSTIAILFLLGAEASGQQSFPTHAPALGDESAFSVDSPIGEIEYTPGRGLHFGRTGLHIGGFTTSEVDHLEGESGTQIELDSVNFLALFEPIDSVRGFAEIEFGDLFRLNTQRDKVRSDPRVDIERLYGDFRYSDAINVRFGKFLTPVGRWNPIPAEPFVWTASDPAIADNTFDEHQTGAAVFGSVYPGSNTLSYWVYGQFIDPLDPSTDFAAADRSVGGRLELEGPLEDWSIGSSFLASELDDRWSTLSGIDALLRIGPLELTSEFEVVDGEKNRRSLWGVYVQGVLGLESLHARLGDLYLVARYEHFKPSGPGGEPHLWDLGTVWIPVPYLNLKAGYRFMDRQTIDLRRGLTASVSVLF